MDEPLRLEARGADGGDVGGVYPGKDVPEALT